MLAPLMGAVLVGLSAQRLADASDPQLDSLLGAELARMMGSAMVMHSLVRLTAPVCSEPETV